MGRSAGAATRRPQSGGIKRNVILASMGLAALVISACGGNAGGGGHSAHSGSPITIMGLIDLTGTGGFYTSYVNAWQAAVDGVNARGGVNGHPLKLQICDTAVNAATEAACGAKAVSEHVPIVLEHTSNGTSLSYLQQGHIADISGGLNVPSRSSPIAFSFWGGPASVAGPLASAKAISCKKVGYILVSGSAAPAVLAAETKLLDTVAGKQGVQVSSPVYPPSTTVDFSPFVQKALANNPDCVVAWGTSGSSQVGVARAVVASGTHAKMIGVQAAFLQATVTSLGSLMNKFDAVGTTVVPTTDTQNPAVRQWVADINKYSANPKDLVASGAYAWASVQLAAYALEHAKSMTSASVLDYLSHLKCYNPVLLPPVSFSSSSKSPFGPRVFSDAWINVRWNGSAWTQLKGYYDIYTGKALAYGPNATCGS